MKKAYLVWDYDPMDGSAGSQYLAAIFDTDEKAKARRNAVALAAWKRVTTR